MRIAIYLQRRKKDENIAENKTTKKIGKREPCIYNRSELSQYKA